MSLESPRYDYQDRALYDELLCKDSKELTKEEKEFIKTMYHLEEYACGLDGDY